MRTHQLYRKLVNPRARRTGSVAIIHSGSKRTVLGCVCGATHTEATRHRGKTKHTRDFRAAHADCMADALRARGFELRNGEWVEALHLPAGGI